MRIDKLEIIKFKNFSDIKISLDSGVNLFVGGNGSGKTSILEAVNVAVGCFFGSQEQKHQRFIQFDEIKITGGIRESEAVVSVFSNHIGNWSRRIDRDTKKNDTKHIKAASDYGLSFFQKFEDINDRTIAPLLAFYSTQRLFKDASLSGKQRYDAANGRRNGYLQCLHNNAIKPLLNEWLGKAATLRATLHIKNIESKDTVLENVEEAVKKTLVRLLNLPPNSPLKIYQDPNFDNELFVDYTEGQKALPLAYYSDGFRNILYLVVDLVWRASQLNPWLGLEDIAKSVAGVVTIDEIDLHLHPKWQAKAIGLLQTIFPKVQFFITTHSPTVVANFQNGSLYVINDDEIEKYGAAFFGKQVNNVLRNVLGAADRHIPTQDKLNTLFCLIDDGKTTEYEPLLEEMIGLLGYEDVEISKALALIEWQKSL